VQVKAMLIGAWHGLQLQSPAHSRILVAYAVWDNMISPSRCYTSIPR
jgi:hypothetical protein